MSEPTVDEMLAESYEYETSVEGSMAIMHAYNEMKFLERMQPIMVEVTRLLIEAGVDFSKVKDGK